MQPFQLDRPCEAFYSSVPVKVCRDKRASILIPALHRGLNSLKAYILFKIHLMHFMLGRMLYSDKKTSKRLMVMNLLNSP